MIWTHDVPVKNGATGANPETAPQNVSDDAIVTLRGRVGSNDAVTGRLLLTLDGLTTEDATVELWALVRDADTAAGRKWAQVATGVVVTAFRVVEVKDTVPAGGRLYVRVTAESVAGDRRLLIQEAA